MSINIATDDPMAQMRTFQQTSVRWCPVLQLGHPSRSGTGTGHDGTWTGLGCRQRLLTARCSVLSAEVYVALGGRDWCVYCSPSRRPPFERCSTD